LDIGEKFHRFRYGGIILSMNRNMRHFQLGRVGVVLAAASLVLTALSISPSIAGAAKAKTPFRMLMIVAVTGPVAGPTAAEIQGTQAAVALINKSGGMYGHRIVMTVANDNLDPTTALSELQQAIGSNSKPNMVFAGTGSNETLAMMPTLTRYKILSMQLAGSSIVDSPYQFVLPNYIPTQAQAVVASIVKNYPSAKNVGIIISNDAQGTALLQYYQTALTKAGLTYNAQTFADTTTNVTPQLQALQATNPDVVIASGYGAVAGYILQDRATLGWKVPVVGDGQLSANNLPALVPSSALTGVSLIGMNSQVYAPLPTKSKAFQNFFLGITKQGADYSEPIILYSLAYDDLILTQLAANQAKSIAAPAIAKALEHLKQPKVKQYVSWSVEGFTPTIHVEQAPFTDYTLVSPFTKLGMYLPLSN